MEIKVTENQLKIQGSKAEIKAGITYLCFTLVNKGLLDKDDFKTIQELAFTNEKELKKELSKTKDLLDELEKKLQNLTEDQLNKLVDAIVKEG